MRVPFLRSSQEVARTWIGTMETSWKRFFQNGRGFFLVALISPLILCGSQCSCAVNDGSVT